MKKLLAIAALASLAIVACSSSAPSVQDEPEAGLASSSQPTISRGCYPLGDRKTGMLSEVYSDCPTIAYPTAPILTNFYLAPDCYYSDNKCTHIICPSGQGGCQYGRDDLYWVPSWPGWQILEAWPRGTDCQSAWCSNEANLTF